MPPNLRSDDTFRRRVLSAFGLWCGLLLVILVPVRHFIAPMDLAPFVLDYVCALLLLAVPILARRGVRDEIGGVLVVIALSGIGMISGYFNGGIRAPATVIFILIPIVGFFCAGYLGAALAIMLSILGVITLLVLEQKQLIQPLKHAEAYSKYMSLVYCAGAAVAYFIGLAYERSRREAQQHSAMLMAMASHANKLTSLGEMAAGLAHEINTPLGLITGNIPLLTKFKDEPEKYASKTHAMLKAAERIEKIVRGLKKFSRTSTEMIRENHQLPQIIQEAMALTDARVKRYSVDIDMAIDGLAVINCDNVEIEQVLVNLINNAIDAIKKKNERWIKIRSQVDGKWAVLQVIDSGLGVSTESEQRLFQPFFTTKPVGEGTGLGLSIVKGILDQHGATIELNRSVQNTCFEIRLPLAMEATNDS